MDKRLREISKEVKAEMLTPLAGCYRLEKLPRTATLESIAKVLKAVNANTDDRSEEWKEVFATKLYRENGAEYCHILAYIFMSGRNML